MLDNNDEAKIIKICPVCGKKGSGIYSRWVYNKQRKRYEPYYYFAHRIKRNGKWTVKWCYVPREIALKYINQQPLEEGDTRSFEVEFREAEPNKQPDKKPKSVFKRMLEKLRG